jgi:hypothetical protein
VGEIRNVVEDMCQHPISPTPFSATTWISEEASSLSRRMVLDLNTTPATKDRERILPLEKKKWT